MLVVLFILILQASRIEHGPTHFRFDGATCMLNQTRDTTKKCHLMRLPRGLVFVNKRSTRHSWWKMFKFNPILCTLRWRGKHFVWVTVFPEICDVNFFCVGLQII